MLTWYVIGQTMQPTIKLISVTEGSAKRQLAVLKDTLKVMTVLLSSTPACAYALPQEQTTFHTVACQHQCPYITLCAKEPAKPFIATWQPWGNRYTCLYVLSAAILNQEPFSADDGRLLPSGQEVCGWRQDQHC